LKWTEKWGEDSGEHWKVRGEALGEYWKVGVCVWRGGGASFQN